MSFLAPKQGRHLEAGEVYQSYLEQNGSRPHKRSIHPHVAYLVVQKRCHIFQAIFSLNKVVTVDLSDTKPIDHSYQLNAISVFRFFVPTNIQGGWSNAALPF